MGSHDHYSRLRAALTEVALEQSNAADRQRWLALVHACSDIESELLSKHGIGRSGARRVVSAQAASL